MKWLEKQKWVIYIKEIYDKVVNGEIDIKYLSPIDLVNLTIYLEDLNKALLDNLDKLKVRNNELKIQKSTLELELPKYIFDSEII